MNMRPFHAARRAAAALVLSAALLAGCSIMVAPKNVPPVKEGERVSFAGDSLAVMNAEKDAAAYDVLTDRGQDSGLRGNRKAWSAKLVEALAGELAERGARVRNSARLKLKVSLPEITLVQTKELYRLKVKAEVTTSTGWKKKYEGVAGMSADSVWTMQNAARQLAERALSGAVTAMLDDKEFAAQCKAKEQVKEKVKEKTKAKVKEKAKAKTKTKKHKYRR